MVVNGWNNNANSLWRKTIMCTSRLMGAVCAFVICLFSANNWAAKSDNPCNEFRGAAFGLCSAFCNAMQCGDSNRQASNKACEKVENQFRRVTGKQPPCLGANPPPGPDLQRCICQDGTQIDVCVEVDCDSGPAQDEVCNPLCQPHGGEFATACFTVDPVCAAQQ